MLKENVVFFSKAINNDSDLNTRVTNAEPTVEPWIQIAVGAGFEFTAEEFADVVGQTLGRSVTVANAVREYLGARYTVGEAELSQRALDSIVGGRMIARTND